MTRPVQLFMHSTTLARHRQCTHPSHPRTPPQIGPETMAGDDLSPGDHGQADATDGSASQPSSKKRKTGPSTRGVANLTPEQLARKRANDREAQRAIRERTKNQIDALNRRIQDLESQQPYHDLQLVLRDKEVIEAELHDTRKRLESIISIASPALRAPAGPHYPPGGPHAIQGPGPSHMLNGVNGVNGLTGKCQHRILLRGTMTLAHTSQNWLPPQHARLWQLLRAPSIPTSIPSSTMPRRPIMACIRPQ